MIRCLILLAVLLVCKTSYGQVVDVQLARTVAENYFDQVAHDTIKAKYRMLVGKNTGEKLAVKQNFPKRFNGKNSYIVNNLEGGGWVIVSADKKTGPVIAYSEQGTYDTLTLPEVMKDWMAQYDTIIEKRRKLDTVFVEKNEKWNSLENSTGNRLKQTYVPGEYLVKSAWDQGDHYNSQVTHSTTDCGTCFAGCVCIAVSQIVNYWGFATGNKADFEFWNMPNVLSSSQTQIDATAYMIKVIGDDKLESDYCYEDCKTSHPVTTSIFSSQPGVGDVLYDLGYYPYSMEYHKCFWYTYNGWLDLLRAEIDAKRPVFYLYIGEHTFICDGYDNTNGNLHFNLGWGINFDNWWSDYEDLYITTDGGITHDYTNTNKHACITGILPDISTDATLNTTLDNGDNKTWQVLTNLVANTVVVDSGAKCQLVGGSSVTLLPGCWAKPGSGLTVKAYAKGPLVGNYKSTSVAGETNATIGSQKTTSEAGGLSPRVYPNPAHGEVTFDAGAAGNGRYEVYDFSGKVVASGNISSQCTAIGLHNVSSGLYMLRLYFNNQYYLFKIINQ